MPLDTGDFLTTDIAAARPDFLVLARIRSDVPRTEIVGRRSHVEPFCNARSPVAGSDAGLTCEPPPGLRSGRIPPRISARPQLAVDPFRAGNLPTGVVCVTCTRIPWTHRHPAANTLPEAHTSANGAPVALGRAFDRSIRFPARREPYSEPRPAITRISSSAPLTAPRGAQ